MPSAEAAAMAIINRHKLIDDLLDNRPEVYQRAKKELLGRLGNTKKERLIELVEMEADNPPRE